MLHTGGSGQLFLLCFLSSPPTLYVYSLLKKGLIKDFHMNIRNERIKPLLVILFNTLLGVGIFYVLGSPKYFIVLALCCLISILLMFFVTLSWKISGHGVAAGGLCVILISSMSEAAIPFTIIVPIIAWSRVILSRHTTMQTIAGVILGFFTFGIPLYLTGLIWKFLKYFYWPIINVSWYPFRPVPIWKSLIISLSG